MIRGELEFFRTRLPAPPAGILEVGCGEGALAEQLAADGYRVTAIDPEAPEGPIFRRERVEEHEGGPYEAVAAARSLHHVDDLATVVAKLARLAPLLVLAEFAWERFDERTARWCEHDLAAWREEHEHLHRFSAIRAALEREFEERYFAWTPYLYDYPGGVDYAAEQAAIDAGAIRALGVRYVGARWTS